jgi:hypothetical protein
MKIKLNVLNKMLSVNFGLTLVVVVDHDVLPDGHRGDIKAVSLDLLPTKSLYKKYSKDSHNHTLLERS